MAGAFFECLDALILAVVVAGGHGHEHGFHAAVLLAPQDQKPFVEILEIFVDALPLVGVLTAAVSQQRFARERTLAGQTAQNAIEAIRALPYESIGIQNGNPSGSVSATETAAQLGVVGLDATVTTKISYVDDAPTTSYQTKADYKKVVVTVKRNAEKRNSLGNASHSANDRVRSVS